MKSFKDLREAASVRSADKKPEQYIGPDGKPKIRMVPVDRQVIKKEQAEDDMPASPDEKSMAMDQAKFLQYVGKEVAEYLNKNKEFPEWMQNKLSGLHEKAKDMHAVLAGDYEDDMKEAYTSFKTGEEKSAFEAGKKAFRSGKKYSDNPHKDEKQKLAWSKGHNQAKARKLGVREETVDEAMTASQHRMAMIDKIKKSGAVKSGSMSQNEEAFKKGDIVKPTKGPHKGHPHEVIHDFGDGHYNIKPTGLSARQIKYGLGAARAHKSELVKESNLDEVLDTPKAMDSYKAKAQYSRDRAAKSAVATNLRSKDKPQREHPAKDLKTMAKRTAGLKMADRAAMRKTYKALRNEEVELDESITKMSNARLKYHATKNFPHGSYTKAEIDAEHKRRQKVEPNYHTVKPSLSEAAPKMKGDWLKKEREKNREHDAAMGRTATGRKKPVRQMTSTQRSLASLRKEESDEN